jgi:hypothetical protein
MYDFVCDCGAKKDFICSFSELPTKIECDCGKTMQREWGIGGFIIHNIEGFKGLYHAKMKMGKAPIRNTTKGFTERVYDPTDKKYHNYSRYYLKNNPQVDPRVRLNEFEQSIKKNKIVPEPVKYSDEIK